MPAISQAQQKSAGQELSCPDLTLLMTGAFYHPETEVRSGLQENLETWIQSLVPIHETKVVERALRECQGTPLEPFWLEPEDIACAVALVRIAFSKKSKANRFRITSRDTIGDGGGFIMTRALQSYFAERYAGAKNPQRHHRCGYFIPGLLPPAGFPGVSSGATLEIDEEGMQVRIPRLDPVAEQVAGRLSDSGWDPLVNDLANRSSICGFDRSLSSIGLRFETDPHSGDLLLRTGSPESCIQFATLLQESPKLFVRAEDRRKHRTEAVVDLSPPGEEGAVDLPLTFVTWRSWCEWMRLEPLDAESPAIIPELKLAVSRWLLPHISWISELDTRTI